MRILLVSPVPPEVGGADIGGIATHAWALATHLSAAGHEVAILADNVPYEGHLSAVLHGVVVYPGKSFRGSRRLAAAVRPTTAVSILRAWRRLGPTWRLGWAASAVSALDTCLRDFRPDVVHVHGIEGRLAVALHAVRARAALVATTHSTHYFEYAPPERVAIHRGLVERNLASLERIVFVSGYLERRYRELFGELVSRMCTHVIVNPLDAHLYVPGNRVAARRALGIADEERLVLFVGNLIDRKRPGLFVDVIARLQESRGKVRAVVVGDGPLREAVSAHIARAGLQDSIAMVGRRSQAELVDYYTAADAFLLPSAMESFGLVAVEAMLCGCPVVGTFEAMQEVVPVSAGTYVDTADAATIAAAVHDVLDSEQDRKDIRAAAMDYDWSRGIDRFIAVYEDAVASR